MVLLDAELLPSSDLLKGSFRFTAFAGVRPSIRSVNIASYDALSRGRLGSHENTRSVSMADLSLPVSGIVSTAAAPACQVSSKKSQGRGSVWLEWIVLTPLLLFFFEDLT